MEKERERGEQTFRVNVFIGNAGGLDTPWPVAKARMTCAYPRRTYPSILLGQVKPGGPMFQMRPALWISLITKE